jgi:hypothetical protein
MLLTQDAGSFNVGEEGVDDHLDGLAMQPIEIHGMGTRLLLSGGRKYRLLLRGLQPAQLAWRLVIKSIHVYGFHVQLF